MATGEMNHGTHCTLRNSIYFEPGGVSAHRFLVCSAALVKASTGSSPRGITLGACISNCRRDDSGSRLCRGWCANGLSGDDWIRRSGNCLPSAAGADRSTCPLASCDCLGLAVYDCWESGHVECNHSISALQYIHLCPWPELGNCHHLCARIAGKQPSDFHAIAQSESHRPGKG